MRYLVFSYDSYYPSGGMSDCIHRGNDFDETMRIAKGNHGEWVELYDTVEDEITTVK